MDAVVGIICEYDPFHRGHRRQFELIRAQLPGARIVCLMSGPFTQRGMPALHSPADRARAALEGGCDLVLELPCAFSVRDAEHFALGGVSILTRLGFVTHLSFGAEDYTRSMGTSRSKSAQELQFARTYLPVVAAEAAAGRIWYNYRYGFFIGVIFWQAIFSCDSE